MDAKNVDPIEYVIFMDRSLRGSVVTGERTECFRPGHRNYREGPATIRFLHDDQNPVDIWILEVLHTGASGITKSFHDALTRLGEPPREGDKVTKLRWTLA